MPEAGSAGATGQFGHGENILFATLPYLCHGSTGSGFASIILLQISRVKGQAHISRPHPTRLQKYPSRSLLQQSDQVELIGGRHFEGRAWVDRDLQSCRTGQEDRQAAPTNKPLLVARVCGPPSRVLIQITPGFHNYCTTVRFIP